MKLKTVCILSFLLSLYSVSNAENPTKFSVKLEFGNHQVSSSLNDKWNVRQDVGSINYNSGSSSGSVLSDIWMNHLALKPEISFFENKIAVSSGLKFTNISSDISMNSYSDDAKKFFYLRYNSNGLTTDFARISGINESNNYLGIPFELRVIPLTIYNIDLYLKTGIEINFRVGSKTNIDFVNEDMKVYEDDILYDVGADVNFFYSSWSSAIGFAFGKKDKLKYNIEFLLPSYILTKNNSSLVTPSMYTGFQCSIQLPVK